MPREPQANHGRPKRCARLPLEYAETSCGVRAGKRVPESRACRQDIVDARPPEASDRRFAPDARIETGMLRGGSSLQKPCEGMSKAV